MKDFLRVKSFKSIKIIIHKIRISLYIILYFYLYMFYAKYMLLCFNKYHLILNFAKMVLYQKCPCYLHFIKAAQNKFLVLLIFIKFLRRKLNQSFFFRYSFLVSRYFQYLILSFSP